MKRIYLFAIVTMLLSIGCRKIEVDGGTTIQTPTTSENTILEGRISSNLTLKAQYTYKLRGLVYVTNGAILTIEPGTKIVGETGQRGARRSTAGDSIRQGARPGHSAAVMRRNLADDHDVAGRAENHSLRGLQRTEYDGGVREG